MDEGWNVSNTLQFLAISMLSAPHPQPFSPEYRGEGSMKLFVVRTPISNSLNLLEENIFIRPPQTPAPLPRKAWT